MHPKYSVPFITSILRRLSFILALGLFIFNPVISSAEEWTYTTRPGDTLWDISKKHLKSANYWSRLQKHNAVDIAKRLSPGTRIRVPLEWLKVQAAPAVVVSVNGTVNYKKAGSDTLDSLSSKQTVTIGDSITTDTNGSALIQFADGSTLQVLKNSQVIFNTLSSYGQTGMVDTRLRLQQGRVETSVRPMRDPSSRYEITTPAAVAAVRGTQFRIAYQDTQKTMASEVVKGTVNVAAEGVAQSVNKGFGTITEQGKPPQSPVKLLTKPVLDDFPEKIRYIPYNFKWPSLEGADKYRIQISPANEAGAIIFEQTIESAELLIKEFTDGQYLVRIRGIDKAGLEGFNAEQAFEVSSNFPVVTLTASEQEFDVKKGPYSLTWSEEKNVSQYHLQVATDSAFKDIKYDQLESTNTATLQAPLVIGEYFWRVTAIDEQGNTGKHSDTGKFTVSENKYEGLWLLLYLLPAFLI